MPRAKAKPASGATLEDRIEADRQAAGDVAWRLGTVAARLDDLARAHKAGDDAIAAAIVSVGESIAAGCDEVAAALREVAAALEAKE